MVENTLSREPPFRICGIFWTASDLLGGMASSATTTAARPRPPLSTYRVQINQQFDLNAAAACVNYLSRLGIDCLYTSPFLQATCESTHGYDTVDY